MKVVFLYVDFSNEDQKLFKVAEKKTALGYGN